MSNIVSLKQKFNAYEEAILVDSLSDEGYGEFQSFLVENVLTLRNTMPDWEGRVMRISRLILTRMALQLGVVHPTVQA